MSSEKVVLEVAEIAVKVSVQLRTNSSPKTVTRLLQALPLSVRLSRWGEEVYTDPTPVEEGEENAVETVEVGDLAYWPPGKALCVFFGPTPVSVGHEIRPASPVNILGKIEGDIRLFRKVKDGMTMKIYVQR